VAALIDFVLSQLEPAPRRVLEIGCGDGELARAVSEHGYDVLAIDPEAPDGAIFRRTTIEELDEPGPFDAVVASLSLHHVHELGAALDKILRLLHGPLILNEFAWDRREPMTPEWEEEHEGLHGYGAMRAELDVRFDERFFEWRPYPVEGEEVPGLGFRYVGDPRVRADSWPLQTIEPGRRMGSDPNRGGMRLRAGRQPSSADWS
jgi:SAM-dependent methyltransferase